jgi:hypothetical protein
MNSKVKLLKQKWLSYNTKAEAYNEIYSPEAEMATPSLEEVKSMDLLDHFWNVGALTHLDEPWAVDIHAQEGILAFFAREAHQAVDWAISKSSHLGKLFEVFEDSNSLSCCCLKKSKANAFFENR